MPLSYAAQESKDRRMAKVSHVASRICVGLALFFAGVAVYIAFDGGRVATVLNVATAAVLLTGSAIQLRMSASSFTSSAKRWRSLAEGDR